MTTAIIYHEVSDSKLWEKAWKKGKGSRHELFREMGIKTRTFHDPKNPKAKAVLAEIPDVAAFAKFMKTADAKKAMKEDGLKIKTVKLLVEFE